MDDELLNSPLGSGHMIDLDTTTGREYIAWSTSILQDPDFFLRHTEGKTLKHLYNQLEYSGEFGRCLCTMYGPIFVLSCMLQELLTPDERYELAKLRYNSADFDPTRGGFVNVGLDVIRNWWNKKHPENPIVTFMIQNDTAIRFKFAEKNIPLVRHFKGNYAFSLDTVDGVLNTLKYPMRPGETYYGHCTGMIWLTIADNYNRSYKYQKWEDYMAMRATRIFEGNTSYAIFFESQLSASGKAWLKMIRAGVTNGERPDDNLLRQENAAMVARLNPTATNFWNKLNGLKAITRYEFVVMGERAFGRKCPIQVYTEKTKDLTISRGEAWQILASW